MTNSQLCCRGFDSIPCAFKYKEWRYLCAGNLLWTLVLMRSINKVLYGTTLRSAQHRGIVKTIRCCLAPVSATMKRGADHVQCLDIRYFKKPSCFSKPGPFHNPQGFSFKNDPRLYQRNNLIFRVSKAEFIWKLLVYTLSSNSYFQINSAFDTRNIRKAGIKLTYYWEKKWGRETQVYP